MQIYPVFIPNRGCPFKCIYCDQTQLDGTSEESFAQLSQNIADFCQLHSTQEKQIAFYGGTFTGLTLSEREAYYQLAAPFLDENTSLRISTRPDQVETTDLEWCKTHGVKTIELGIQDFNEEVLQASRRGYDSGTAISACRRVQAYGFELGVQLMPGLPNFSNASMEENKMVLQELHPSYLRLYPLIIIRGTALWETWKAGKFNPLSMEDAIDICADYCILAQQNNISVIKIGIPPLRKGSEYAGPYHPAFGELVKGELLIRDIVAGYNSETSIFLSTLDISLLTAHEGYNISKLMNRLGRDDVKIMSDLNLAQGEIKYIR